MNALVATDISKTYKTVQALRPTSLTLQPGKIVGLIGRNGAGKTTLLSLLSAQSPVTTGRVEYDGQPVWENEKALGNLCFSRELNPVMLYGENSFKGKHYLDLAQCYYPHWDEAYARRLLADFELDIDKKIGRMSKGMMSMLTIVLALASRAPITMLDEPVAGLDIAMRERFYHLLLDKGELKVQVNTEEYLARFRYVAGREDAVAAVAAGLTVWHREGIGRQQTWCVEDPEGLLAGRARGTDVELAGVPLQKVFLYVTGGEKEGDIA